METITTGKRLKALREDRGLSQSQLAKKADINSRVPRQPSGWLPSTEQKPWDSTQ